jgi:hypothetical protein
MNFLQLKTALKRYGFDDNDPLDIWTNAARNEMWSDLDWATTEERHTFTLPANQAEYSSLPANCFKPRTLTPSSNGVAQPSLDYIEWREFRKRYDSNEQGFPHKFTLWNIGNLRFFPVPTQSVDFEMIFHAGPVQMTGDNDQPEEFHEIFHYIIVYRSAAIGLMAENEEDRAQTAMAEYASGLDRVLRAYGAREQDQYATVQDAMEYN